VGLRGYGGTDPLVEFKREAYKLYEELRGFIRHNVASTIFRVNVQVQQPAPPPQPQAMPMPTPEQLALIRARAATAANQRAAAAAASAAASTPAPAAASAATPDTADDGVASGPDLEAFETELVSEAELEAEALAAGDAQPSTAPTTATTPVIPGLGSQPRKMTLQKGDETVDSISGVQSGAPKVGRNDPCYCGSGMKYKKCHGK
jgi:preprotein translocase subunit SecA